MTAMSIASNEPSKRKDRGWWYPWIFVAAFLVVVGVNGIMITIAVTTFTGLETKDHFEKGVKYDQAIAGAKAQEALGWSDAFAFTADASKPHAGLIDVKMTDKAGNAITGLDIKALVVRPVQDGYDTEVTLRHLGAGRYVGDIDVPLPGLWEIRLLAYGPKNANYQAVHRITVK